MLTAWLFFWVKLLLLVITQQAKKPHGSWACACQVDLAVLFPSSPSLLLPAVPQSLICPFISFIPSSVYCLHSPSFPSFIFLCFLLFPLDRVSCFPQETRREADVKYRGTVFLALSRTCLEERGFLVSGDSCIPCDRIWNSLAVLVSVLLILSLQSKWIRYFLGDCFYGYARNKTTVKKVFVQGL